MAIRIRTKIIASLSAILAILSALIITTYYNRNLLFNEMLELEESMTETGVISRLQVNIERSVMPANDYLITGNREEAEAFEAATGAIEKDLAWLASLSHENHIAFDTAAAAKFKLLKLKAHRIFEFEDPVGNAKGAALMKEVDAISSEISGGHLAKSLAAINRENQDKIEKARGVRDLVDTLIFAGALASLLTVLAVIAYLTKSIVRPLIVFREGTAVIGKGDLEHRIELRDGLEINNLVDAFNKMTEKLRSSYADLEKKVEMRTKELNETNLKLKELSVTDGLTGAYNHRFFYKKLGEEVGRASRYRRPFSIIMSDVDYFKRYNDTNGHMAGDAVLKGIVFCLQKGLRKEDTLARYGGEEFSIILPETAKAEALMAAERLRGFVESEPFHNAGAQPSGHVTISLGVASYPDDAQDPSGLIAAADRALYSAKENGRNTVEAANAEDAVA